VLLKKCDRSLQLRLDRFPRDCTVTQATEILDVWKKFRVFIPNGLGGARRHLNLLRQDGIVSSDEPSGFNRIILLERDAQSRGN